MNEPAAHRTALVTGAGGFAGGYLVDALRARDVAVVACGGPQETRAGLQRLDVTDPASLDAAFERAQPDVVYHLAAQTFVPESIASPLETYRVNALGTAMLAGAARDFARRHDRAPRILFASSAEVYGRRDPSDFPLTEGLDVRPANPYAASKAAAEAVLLAETRSLGLDAVVARAFNHVGPGQSERFVLASFAAQLAAIARGAPPVLVVGNLDAARDVLDVRDVVRAYIALAQRGETGEIYNVCGGAAVKIRDLLRELLQAANVAVEVREDPARMRPSDVPTFVGSAGKLRAQTGWLPEIPLTRSVRDVYAAALAAGNPAASS